MGSAHKVAIEWKYKVRSNEVEGECVCCINIGECSVCVKAGLDGLFARGTAPRKRLISRLLAPVLMSRRHFPEGNGFSEQLEYCV